MLTHFVSDKIVKLVIMPNYDTSFSILSKAEYMSIYYLDDVIMKAVVFEC